MMTTAMLMLAAVTTGFDPAIPFNYDMLGVEDSCKEIRKIHAETGIRRFFVTGPGFNKVMYGPFPSDTYAQIGRDIAEMKRRLADTPVELSWWCAPSIRYFSDFPSIEDSQDFLFYCLQLFTNRPPIIGERILPAADFARPGKLVNAFYIFFAGTEGTVRTFAVLATSLVGNRSSGLFNLRKQELLRNLLQRLDPDSLPVTVPGVPSIWTLANVSADRREMMVTVNNLSGDVRRDLPFAFAKEWQGAAISVLASDGSRRPLGRVSPAWTAPLSFGQMEPEFLFVEKRRMQ